MGTNNFHVTLQPYKYTSHLNQNGSRQHRRLRAQCNRIATLADGLLSPVPPTSVQPLLTRCFTNCDNATYN